jgi:hypothetical protein
VPEPLVAHRVAGVIESDLPFKASTAQRLMKDCR